MKNKLNAVNPRVWAQSYWRSKMRVLEYQKHFAGVDEIAPVKKKEDFQ